MLRRSLEATKIDASLPRNLDVRWTRYRLRNEANGWVVSRGKTRSQNCSCVGSCTKWAIAIAFTLRGYRASRISSSGNGNVQSLYTAVFGTATRDALYAACRNHG